MSKLGQNLQQKMAAKMSMGPVMTPELRQAITLLTMPIQDIHQFVSNELLENPFLQEEGSDDYTETQDTAENLDSADSLTQDNFSEDNSLDHDWQETYDADGANTSGLTGSTTNFSGDFTDMEQGDEAETLADHLLEQLHYAVFSPQDRFLGAYLIDALDDSGYLRLNLPEAAKKLNIDVEKLEDLKAILQTFDPPGIAASDLAECLRLQLHAQDNLTDTAEIVLNHLDLLAKRDFPKLQKLTGASQTDILETAEDIATCNPKPGLAFARGTIEAVIPDVIVQSKENEWIVELNSAALPKVLVNQTAKDIFAGANNTAKQYITERTHRANWLVKSLEQRAKTILKVSRLIVQEQADFFTYGIESLKPLTLRDIAEKAEVHESTVSRVTSGKYMQTPLGTFELKHFFSAGINTTGGNMEVAAHSVKAIIKRLIEAEDPKKPLSDEKLVASLKGEGIDIARRTVAKYREALNIGSSSQRRLR